MANIAQDGITVINRSYIDNFAVKEFGIDTILEKYFPDIQVNKRSVGMVGYVNEQISNITEDVFNTGSVLFRETFPNRAEIDESIYSHAAVFQLTDIFSKPSSCTFVIVLEESAVQKNMVYDKSGYYYFYIDKDTKVLVKDIPFTLDYDIEMRIIKKHTDKKDEYIYTARYIWDYVNTISNIDNPYIKIRRNGGYIALEVTMHQCERTVVYEPITINSKINYPVIDIPFEGDLCGFDILYNGPLTTGTIVNSETPNVLGMVDDSILNSMPDNQMIPIPVYSNPLSRCFCYYQLKDANTLRISFNSKDMYFMPAFNSEIEVILYTTLGEGGKFDIYTGTDIEVIGNNDKYDYPEKYIMSARPLSKSDGGMKRIELNALQALAVEGYRTANALTTDNDLQEYFNNFKNRYGRADIMFTKLRDDIRERIFSAFMVVYNETVAYKTNCLDLSTNLSEMKNPEENVYTFDPGVLFRYSDKSDTDAEIFYEADFLWDEELNDRLWKQYQQAIIDGTIPYIKDTSSEIPDYLDRPASFAEFKKRKGYDSKLTVFDLSRDELQEYDDPQNGKFLYVNPFLIRFKKNPNIINMYLPFVNDRLTLDYIEQNNDDLVYVQFITYWMDIKRKFEKRKVYHIDVEIFANIEIANTHPLLDTEPPITDPQEEGYGETIYKLGDPYNVVNNDLRVVLVINDGNRDVAFAEMTPTDYDPERRVFVFSVDIKTDDHITSDGRLRLLSELKWRDDETGDYYMVTEDNTIYMKYNSNNVILEESVPVDEVSALIKDGKLHEWYTVSDFVENKSTDPIMKGTTDILIPCSGAICRIETLYRRVFRTEEEGLALATSDDTNNIFVEKNPSFDTYVWTNRYETIGEHASFMYPLEYVRSDLQFLDYTEKDKDGNFTHDIMDVHMRSIPLIKWDLPLNEDEFQTFINTYLGHYKWIVSIINERLRNVTAIDVKWYNTYGKSKNYAIGDGEEIINTVNLVMRFDMWFLPGTDITAMIERVKVFIKQEVERLNDDCVNYLHISNLMRKIEHTFACVDHIRFININNYPTTYQSVKVLIDDVNDLPKRERMIYVPEMLSVDLENIIINSYEIDSY